MNQYRATDNDYNQKKDILTKILKDAERERLDQDDVPVTLEEVKDALDEAENLVNFVTIEKLQEQLEDAGEETLMIRCDSRPTAQERRGSRIG
jgi:DNA-binding TFAR19-related protein (PDSD5 family)